MLPKPRTVRCLAFVMAFAIAFASAATCLAAVVAATPTMVCHGSDEHPVDGTAIAENCCPGDSTNSQATVPTAPTTTSVSAPPMLPAIVSIAVEPPSAPVGLAQSSPGTSKPPGVATYVFISSFRL